MAWRLYRLYSPHNALHSVSQSCILVQAQLGDIVFVELPDVGAELEKEGQFGVVESVKVLHFLALE